jgi:hypothetical protein
VSACRRVGVSAYLVQKPVGLRTHADTPLRRHADTVLQVYAHNFLVVLWSRTSFKNLLGFEPTPIRPYADTPTRFFQGYVA